jgi:hypothetical protein
MEFPTNEKWGKLAEVEKSIFRANQKKRKSQ